MYFVRNYSMCFKRIIIPLNLAENAGLAVSKAVELCTSFESFITLLHIVPPATSQSEARDLKAKLEGISENIQTQSGPSGITIEIIKASNIEQAIVQYCLRYQADLVIICKNNFHRFWPSFSKVSPASLAFALTVPVLTLSSTAPQRKMRRIVVPVAQNIPAKSIQVIRKLSQLTPLTISLVTISNNNNSESGLRYSTTAETFRILKHLPKTQVEYHVMNNNTLRGGYISYLKHYPADVLLLDVNEGQSSMFNKDMSKLLAVFPGLQLISIKEEQYVPVTVGL